MTTRRLAAYVIYYKKNNIPCGKWLFATSKCEALMCLSTLQGLLGNEDVSLPLTIEDAASLGVTQGTAITTQQGVVLGFAACHSAEHPYKENLGFTF